MNVGFKKTVLVGHRWAGLTIGLAAAFLALTGLTMAFRAQLEPQVDARFLDRTPCDARLPLDTLVAHAKAAHPGKALQRIEVPDIRTAATVVRFADREGVYLDACSGEVLGQRSPWGGFFGFIEMTHKLRWITEDGDVTEKIGSTIAMLVVLMACGGLFLAWPASRRALNMIVKPRLKPGNRAFDLLLHRSVGCYVFIVVVTSMVCSLSFTVPPPPTKPPARGPGNALSLEQFLQKMRALVPDLRTAQLTPPRKQGQSFEVYAVERGAPHAYARSYAWFEPATGETLRFEPYADSSAANKAWRWMSALHTARAGILPQIVLFMGILGVPVLAFTGLRSFLRTRRATGEKP
jgi:vanillate O-demethylase ferredoxin subunit